MEDAQFIGLEWNLVVRGVVETLVMLTAATWLLAKARRGPTATTGGIAALVYAVLIGVLTYGSAQTLWTGAQPSWLTTVYLHGAITDWTRVVCLLVVVVAFIDSGRKTTTKA